MYSIRKGITVVMTRIHVFHCVRRNGILFVLLQDWFQNYGTRNKSSTHLHTASLMQIVLRTDPRIHVLSNDRYYCYNVCDDKQYNKI